MAAYDLLVNKRHGVEYETLWEVLSNVAGNGDKTRNKKRVAIESESGWILEVCFLVLKVHEE